MKLVFLLEEPSMKYLLDELLPRILPENVEFQTIPHKGKQALERSIPRKLRGWTEPGDVRFVILHDQDTKDCVKLKQDLMALCAGRANYLPSGNIEFQMISQHRKKNCIS